MTLGNLAFIIAETKVEMAALVNHEGVRDTRPIFLFLIGHTPAAMFEVRLGSFVWYASATRSGNARAVEIALA